MQDWDIPLGFRVATFKVQERVLPPGAPGHRGLRRPSADERGGWLCFRGLVAYASNLPTKRLVRAKRRTVPKAKVLTTYKAPLPTKESKA